MDSDYLFESGDWLEDEKVLAKIDEDLDFALAFSLQEEFNETLSQETLKQVKSVEGSPESISKSLSRPKSVIDPQWELIDPNPNIQALFLEFNAYFFYSKLDGIEVKWSKTMTLCAGVCSYEGRGGLCSVRLSTPLLKLRPRKDLVETLLHEMIHAYLFVTENNKDRNGHGPEFLSHMHRINKETGANITVYHSFHDEVDFYRKHWWKCDGPCQSRKPYFGIVKRATNRAPSTYDPWWSQHQATCGGTYHKIKEPENYKQKAVKRKLPANTNDQKPITGITDFFKSASNGINVPSSSKIAKKPKDDMLSSIRSIFSEEDNLVSICNGIAETSNRPLAKEIPQAVPFSGQGFKLGSSCNDGPKSFLSKIRKELAQSNCRNGSQSALETFKQPNTKMKSESKEIKSQPKKESVTDGRNKLIQSSMDNFVSPPRKTSAQGLSNLNIKASKSFYQRDEQTKSALPSAANTNAPVPQPSSSSTVVCPVCCIDWPETEINAHLDQCLLSS